ncbi:unnamed protein product, partial [marine sediment metagenome]
IFENIYLIPHLLGELKITDKILDNIDIDDDEWVDKEDAYHLPAEYVDLWLKDKEALKWLKKIYHDNRIQNAIKEYTDMKESASMSDASDFKKGQIKKMYHEMGFL